MAKLIRGVNDLATTHPELATQWHPDNNGLTATDVSAGSNKIVKWLFPYDVPMDYHIEHLRGKHFDFEWEAEIKSRARGATCPYLVGKAVWPGFNDLATTHPKVAAEWHPTKNGDLTPQMVSAGSSQKVYWRVWHRNEWEKRGRYYEWIARVEKRASGSQCPQILSSKGEKLIRDILKHQGVSFEEQHIFADRKGLTDKSYLKDDFAILDRFGKVVGTIEFNGEHHYKPVGYGGKAAKKEANVSFAEIQTRDMMKTNYLESHGIKQLEIHFQDIDKLDEIVPAFIQELSQEHQLFSPQKLRAMEKAKEVNADKVWEPPSKTKISKSQKKEFLKTLQGKDKKIHSNTSNLKHKQNSDLSISI